MAHPLRRAAPILLVAALALTTAGCAPDEPAGPAGTSPAGAATATGGAASAKGPTTVTVSSTADSCELSARTAPEGQIVFSVTNDGTEPTEFYLYDEDGQQIVGEVENIGPGLTRDLTVNAVAGMYQTACKPGMVGDGIRAPFTVE